MKIESIGSLVDWTKDVHRNLSRCFGMALKEHPEERSRALLDYLKHHEARLARMVAGFEEQADPKALHTMVYDYELHAPVDIHEVCRRPYASMSYDAIADEVFAMQNEVIDLYRYLVGRSTIPEEQEVLEELLSMEHHETMQMSQQVNRGRDI
ncbi:hypothetical protein ACXYTJ_12500 [Gilvimarinus sp. F26214L]|uniref:hypothetical protein n=1 Tax=Gilvimarinus sp. DZF01 TaxID=3461371 RepID=UPI0040463C6F